MSYQRRDIVVQITLAEGTFDNNNNILTLKNMKCECSIAAFGGLAATSMDISIYGLSLINMSKLTGKTQRVLSEKQNLIKVMANDETVFIGTITASRINLNQMPDAPIEITANSVGYERTQPITDTSIAIDTSVADMVLSIANKVGLKFVNVDVNAKAFAGEHATGNAIQQIDYLANAYGFNKEIDLGTVTIFTGNEPIDSVVPFVSPHSGLKGYPIFYDIGINFRTIFSTSLRVGRNVQLKTSLPNGSGLYRITNGTTHYLSSNTDGGLWDTFVVAFPVGIIGASQ